MAASIDFSASPRREGAAKRLGISVATLRRYEGELLHPMKDGNGHHRFDPEDLRAAGPEVASGANGRRRLRRQPRVHRALPRPRVSRSLLANACRVT